MAALVASGLSFAAPDAPEAHCWHRGDPGILASTNTITDSGRNNDIACVEAFGTDHVLSRNVAARCTLAGFFVQGRRVRLEANRALANYRHGILVSGLASQTGFPEDTVLQANIANENAAFGIAVLFAERTNVTGNTGLRNRTDFCDQGTGTVATGNTFGVVASNACLN